MFGAETLRVREGGDWGFDAGIQAEVGVAGGGGLARERVEMDEARGVGGYVRGGKSWGAGYF